MSGPILDGTGTGRAAKIDANNALHVRSRTFQEPALKCVEGEVFLVSTPWYTLPAAGGRLIWMQFTDPLYNLVVDSLHVNYNGGSTSHNRACQVEYYLGDTAPTVGTTPYGAANTNTLSTKELLATLLAWNGVTGTGMTGHTPGSCASRMMCGQGYTATDVAGRMIVGAGVTLSINVKPEEEGIVSLAGFFHLQSINE